MSARNYDDCELVIQTSGQSERLSIRCRQSSVGGLESARPDVLLMVNLFTSVQPRANSRALTKGIAASPRPRSDSVPGSGTTPPPPVPSAPTVKT